MSTAAAGTIFIVSLIVALAIAYRYFGDYMYRVVSGRYEALACGAIDLPNRWRQCRCRAVVGCLRTCATRVGEGGSEQPAQQGGLL